MPTLDRPVGLGLAARGEPDEVARWTRQSADLGFESVWIHDSYYERDPITFATAMALELARGNDAGTRVALGAVNAKTRHPMVLAMTGSALDEILPGKIVMGLGTGLPMRLAQMGIPYDQVSAREQVSDAMDQLRTLWAGERIPSATPGLPPVQPMFPPTHHIPLVIAAYRKEFVDLAGQKADGYLARPAESIPSLRGILNRLDRAATEAGRDPASIERSGYLLALSDRTRRAALNRAKREPFVIFMMAVLSDVSLRRAGFDRELRDRIAAAWQQEDYTTAGNLIPDELLDAFILCGTPEDIAEKAQAYYTEAGLQLPVLQPIVQEESQVEDMFTAAMLYSEAPATVPQSAPQPVTVAAAAASAQPEREAPAVAAASTEMPQEVAAAGLAGDHRLSPARRIARFGKGVYEILRPFSFTASLTPVAVGGAVAFFDKQFEWPFFAAAIIAALMLHAGTNVINEIYDVRKGIDTITSPRASHAIVTGRVTERQAFMVAYAAFAIAAVLGLALVVERGPIMLGLGVAGLIGGWGYTAPPLQYKYHAFGLPLVFMLMGPLMVTGSYFAITGAWSWEALLLSIPVGLLVTAILQGNEWRDISEDRRAGITTLSIALGKQWAHFAYLGMVVGAFLILGLMVAFDLVPPAVAVAMLALPLLMQVVRSADLGASGQARAIAMIDVQTAQLHFVFGGLLVLGVLLARGISG